MGIILMAYDGFWEYLTPEPISPKQYEDDSGLWVLRSKSFAELCLLAGISKVEAHDMMMPSDYIQFFE